MGAGRARLVGRLKAKLRGSHWYRGSWEERWPKTQTPGPYLQAHPSTPYSGQLLDTVGN